MTPRDQRPVVRLDLGEELAFMRMVWRETRRPARRLLDLWARPDDLGPCTEALLTETFRLLWRGPGG